MFLFFEITAQIKMNIKYVDFPEFVGEIILSILSESFIICAAY